MSCSLQQYMQFFTFFLFCVDLICTSWSRGAIEISLVYSVGFPCLALVLIIPGSGGAGDLYAYSYYFPLFWRWYVSPDIGEPMAETLIHIFVSHEIGLTVRYCKFDQVGGVVGCSNAVQAY